MKRIVTIQDISCVGKCSLTVALPIISAMGVETCIIPTAVLSTHTVFQGFTFRDLTSDITKICDHWEKENFKFDAIYTGYLGSFEQLNIISNIIDKYSKESLVLVDPCMADDGKLYAGFTTDFAIEMKKLCAKADIIVPNLTEACFMLNIPYKHTGYDFKYIKNILLQLADTGAKTVILKGIEFSEQQPEINIDVNGKIGIFAYERESDTINWYFHEKISEKFHGTGDIFASVLTGAIMRGKNIKEAYSLAAEYVLEAIKATISHNDHNFYGVDFETVIPYLIKRL